jgi:hypothetical protein
MIRDVHPGYQIWIFFYPGSRSWIQVSKKHRIRIATLEKIVGTRYLEDFLNNCTVPAAI